MRVWAASLVMAAAASACGDSRAREPAQCDVRIIHALHNGETARRRRSTRSINRLRPYLENAPFTAWREFKLLDRKELTIAVNGRAASRCPTGARRRSPSSITRRAPAIIGCGCGWSSTTRQEGQDARHHLRARRGRRGAASRPAIPERPAHHRRLLQDPEVSSSATLEADAASAAGLGAAHRHGDLRRRAAASASSWCARACCLRSRRGSGAR